MARMVPPTIRDKAPRSERVVFEKLREGPKDWVVIHSLLLPGAKAQGSDHSGSEEEGEERETDFLILIPDHAVILLEVKGGGYSVDKSGVWTTLTGKPVEPPFSQARAQSFALKDYVERQCPGDRGLTSIKYDSAVLFTNHEWPSGARNPPAYHFFDHRVIGDVGKLVANLEQLAKRLSRRRGRKRPTADILDRLRRLLCPEMAMRYAWRLGSDLDRIDGELLELTEAQYSILENIQDQKGDIRNDRVLIQGGAGTGKTMLAIQLARLRHQAGDRVAFACSNALLGNWLREQLPEIPSVGNLSQVFFRDASLDRISGPNRYHGSDDFMDIALKASDQLSKEGRTWDYLIVDEAHIMIDPQLFEAFDVALEGGLREGRWAMFGDFETQNWGISSLAWRDYAETVEWRDAREILSELCPGAPSGKGWYEPPSLKVNCRNTMSVARSAARMVNLRDVQVMRNNIEGPDVSYHYWDGNQDVLDLLETEFARLRGQGVSPRQVVVVTNWMLDIAGGGKIGPWSMVQGGDLPSADDVGAVRAYSLGHFAGMESDVVILAAGIEDGEDTTDSHKMESWWAPMLYEGMTRAKGLLIVLARVHLKEWIESKTAATD